MISAVPKPLIYLAITAVFLAFVPPALIARVRAMNSDARRIHLVQDMDNQASIRAQAPNPLFRDGRGARPPVGGTVARGGLRTDDHLHIGFVDGRWVDTFPPSIEVDRALVERGRERYDIYCAICHGYAGYGDGMVHRRAMELVNNPAIGNETQWVQPRSLHDPAVRSQSPGEIFNTITNGRNTMAGYQAQVPVRDRWAIVAWVRALQRSQNARPADLGGTRPESLDLFNLRQSDQEPQQ